MLALPLLDAMVPALSALARTPADGYRAWDSCTCRTARRCVSGSRRERALRSSSRPPSLPSPRSATSLIVPTGLSQVQAQGFGDGNGEHTRGQAVWLSGMHIKRTEGADVENGTTVDQHAVAAAWRRHAARVTRDRPRAELPGRQLRQRLQLRLHQYHRVAHADDADAGRGRSRASSSSDCSAAARPPAQRRSHLQVDHSILDSVNRRDRPSERHPRRQRPRQGRRLRRRDPRSRASDRGAGEGGRWARCPTGRSASRSPTTSTPV